MSPLLSDTCGDETYFTMVETAKVEAILAFYNVFTEDLQLVECDSLADISFLLHSVTNFIVSGILTYQSHEKFGFFEAVKFLQKESVIDFGTLNPRAAASGDEFEILKILIAILCTIRIIYPERLAECISKVSAQNRRHLLAMIKYLDSLDTNAPKKREQWQQCLTQVPSDLDLDIALFTDELTDPLSSPQCSIAADSEVVVVRSRRSISPLVAALVDVVSDGGGIGPSPSARSSTALYTPKKRRRSSMLLRMKQSERRISELREQLEIAGCELDVCQERRDALKAELELKAAACKNLQSRLKTANAEREELKRDLARSTCETMLTRQELMALEERHRVDGERYAVEAEHDRIAVEALRAELEQALADTQKTLTLRDALERQTDALSALNEKYVKVAENEQLLHFRVQELIELVSFNEQRHRHCLLQKYDEFAAQLQLAEQVKENYAMRVRELEAALLAEAARSCSADESEAEIIRRGVLDGIQYCRKTTGKQLVGLENSCVECHTFKDGNADRFTECDSNDDVSVDQQAFYTGMVTISEKHSRLLEERLIALCECGKTTTTTSQEDDAEERSGSDYTDTEDDVVVRWVEESRRHAALSAARKVVKSCGGDECGVKEDGKIAAMSHGKVLAALAVTAIVSATLAFCVCERLKTS